MRTRPPEAKLLTDYNAELHFTMLRISYPSMIVRLSWIARHAVIMIFCFYYLLYFFLASEPDHMRWPFDERDVKEPRRST